MANHFDAEMFSSYLSQLWATLTSIIEVTSSMSSEENMKPLSLNAAMIAGRAIATMRLRSDDLKSFVLIFCVVLELSRDWDKGRKLLYPRCEGQCFH